MKKITHEEALLNVEQYSSDPRTARDFLREYVLQQQEKEQQVIYDACLLKSLLEQHSGVESFDLVKEHQSQGERLKNLEEKVKRYLSNPPSIERLSLMYELQEMVGLK